MKRVELLRKRRRAESDARFKVMLARLEAQWRKRLKLKPRTRHTPGGVVIDRNQSE